MVTIIWIVAALALVVVGLGVVTAVRRHHAVVPTRPLTISVAGPVEETLESPREAAEGHAARPGSSDDTQRRAGRGPFRRTP
jgi:hypothetical protein